MISPKTKGAIRILIELRLQGRRPALSALSLLCCTRVGISRQSAAVPRLCPLLRVVGLTEQLIAGHEGPALVPDGTLACPGPAVRQRPTSTPGLANEFGRTAAKRSYAGLYLFQPTSGLGWGIMRFVSSSCPGYQVLAHTR